MDVRINFLIFFKEESIIIIASCVYCGNKCHTLSAMTLRRHWWDEVPVASRQVTQKRRCWSDLSRIRVAIREQRSKSVTCNVLNTLWLVTSPSGSLFSKFIHKLQMDSSVFAITMPIVSIISSANSLYFWPPIIPQTIATLILKKSCKYKATNLYVFNL